MHIALQAIGQLRKELEIDADRPEAEWCLGNAYTSLGFFQDVKAKAEEQFQKAAASFRRCQAKVRQHLSPSLASPCEELCPFTGPQQ